MITPRLVTFKLFWIVAAIFASLNALLIAAVEDYKPTLALGGLPGNNELVQHMIYNLTWSSTNATAMSFYVAQFSDPKTNTSLPTEHYTLAENTTDNPFKWNVTMPVGTNLALSMFPNAGNISHMDFLDLRVVSSKTSSASKMFMTSAPMLGFMVPVLVALMYL